MDNGTSIGINHHDTIGWELRERLRKSIQNGEICHWQRFVGLYTLQDFV